MKDLIKYFERAEMADDKDEQKSEGFKMQIPKGRITITMNSGIEYKHDIFEQDCKNQIFNLQEHSDFLEKIFTEMETMTIKDKDATSIYRIKDISILEIKQLF